MEDLTISIVVYKTEQAMLKNLLGCLSGTDLDIRIFVVDNSPTDGIKEICRGEKFTYIFNNRNIGYGAAHNVAIRNIINKSRYHLVINPDIHFDKGVLENIFRFMENNRDVGLLIPKILSMDGSIDYSSKLLPKPQNLIFRRFGFAAGPFRSYVERMNGLYELRFTGYDKIMDIPFASGCFMFIRNEALRDAGIFDERYFMYMEDADLTRRIHRHHRTVHFPEAVVYHRNRRGSYSDPAILRHHIVSAFRYFNKWGWFFDQDRDRINRETLSKAGG